MSIASEISRLQSDSTAIASAIAAKGVTVPSGSGYDDYATLIGQISGGGSAVEFDDWLKDGDTHLWVNIVNDYQLAQQIRIRMIGTIDWGDGTTIETANATSDTTFTHTYTNTGRYRIDLHPTSGTFTLGGGGTNWTVMGARSNNAYYRIAALYQAELGSSIMDTIRSYSFYACLGLQRVYIPKNITTASTNVFYNCYSLTYLEFEDATKLTSAGNNFFYGCYSLQDLGGMKPDWGTTLNSNIRTCYSLTDFTIPSNVTDIAAATFQNTYSLLDLWVYPASPPTVANANAFAGINPSCVIHVPNGKLSAYQTANIWSTYASQMVEMPASS
jgi:hypothetical protein